MHQNHENHFDSKRSHTYLHVFWPDLDLVALTEPPEIPLHLLVDAGVLVVDLLLPKVLQRLKGKVQKWGSK